MSFEKFGFLVLASIFMVHLLTNDGAKTAIAATGKTLPPASQFATFYCDYPFDRQTPQLNLKPSAKATINEIGIRMALGAPARQCTFAGITGRAALGSQRRRDRIPDFVCCRKVGFESALWRKSR